METDIKHPKFLKHYARSLFTYDEMMDERGEIREHWKPFHNVLKEFSEKDLSKRQKEINQLLRENGVTYNVYNRSQEMDRPWELDLVPLIIQKADWEIIEKGIQQRAELLNLILSDLYGQRMLVKEGLLPIELVYSHSGFLRQCDGIKFDNKYQLIIYACDMARGPDGRMWVINDRTQAPSGSGYALENRAAMLRVAPDLVRPVNIAKLSGYFSHISDSLPGLLNQHKEDARVVVLTPGYYNETYFEHAYLASQLGYKLVEGSDLMVKNKTVWLKTLSGLEKVDVIIRRLDDSYCDPLELRPDSQLGVTGLLSAIRAKNVSVVNPLGSSILENPGLLPFLPGIAKFFLNEKLILPSAATWWCGQKKEMDYVIENADKLVIKAIDRGLGFSSYFGDKLSKTELEQLRTRIRTTPHNFIGQQQVSFSTAPSLVRNHLKPRYTVLRSFAFAGKDGYKVMPGGLSRSSSHKENSLVSNQLGGRGKDTWVMEDLPKHPPKIILSPLTNKSIQPLPSRDSSALSSRSAESLFWTGRYLQRSLFTARMLRIILQNFNQNKLSGKETVESDDLKGLLRALTHITMTYPGFVGKGGENKFDCPEREIISVALNAKRPGSLANNLLYLKNNVFAVRDQWSRDVWRLIENVENQWEYISNNQRIRIRKVQIILDYIITTLVAFLGLNAENMQRDMGWFMMQIGSRLEKGLLNIASMRALLVPCYDEQTESTLNEALLSLNEGLESYRSRYKSHFHVPFVLEMLLFDKYYPKSIAYQFEKLGNYINRLPNKSGGYEMDKEDQLILDAYTKIRLAKLDDLSKASDEAFLRTELDDLLKFAAGRLADTANVITQNYFSHTHIQQQLTENIIDPEI
ncbi:circularly permuted type 2 ATP-grasp protein [Flammeovirgaceae bacterium SG7u.111]|nr:circularly permuted type 2 ATP-grasp protein [Flammeovirgaceae bacterium SG7u.132]WPO33979.1 circularly permuted type 2 ATP-grasp protein [Flammeovirgaceae bacterium SG7u.111]